MDSQEPDIQVLRIAVSIISQAFVNTWEKNGEVGNYVNAATGEIIIFNSTSGAIAPAGLVLASRYFDEPKFLENSEDGGRPIL